MAAADVSPSLEKIGSEQSVSRVLHVACGELVELLDATFASVSRVIGDLLVELSGYRRDGGEHPLELFLVTDYPLTQDVIRTASRGSSAAPTRAPIRPRRRCSHGSASTRC